MIALLQRVTQASVEIEGRIVGAIGRGVAALVCAEPGDDEANARRLLDKMLAFRMFPDGAGRMNLSLADIGGELLLVPQFTLGADTSKGLRPSFSSVLAPEAARRLFEYLLREARTAHGAVATGEFGARMRVALVNDGPVTFWLRVAARGAPALS